MSSESQKHSGHHSRSNDQNVANEELIKPPISVVKFFTAELTRGYQLDREEEKYAQKRQRVYTFMKTPRELEKFSTYGFFQCLDAFLFIFTFLPLRILLALLKVLTTPCRFVSSRNFLEPAQICDLLKGVILVVGFFMMTHIDTSMMYHLVRGQATIKLYVFFNMLDMADRLLSNFGHDILDALFWTATEPRGRKRDHFGTLPHLAIAIIYVILHTLLILFQATVLNVAFNSHNKSLLVIMMSNNFVEIKANLFKKVDGKHLYQISCSDVKERFHYVLLLAVVCIRNMTEVSWNLDHLWVLLPDAMMVLISEVLVDWGKHAFILKFNEIPADVYREFKVNLAIDMVNSRQNKAFTDHSDLVSRRMGLTPLPLACLLFRILSKSVKLTSTMSYVILFVIYLCLVTFKVLNSIVLLGQSYDLIESVQRQKKEEESAADHQNKGCLSDSELIVESKQPSPMKHKRNASDSKVLRNFSQVFAADSYTELTLVSDPGIIEQSGGISFAHSSFTNSQSDSPLQNLNNSNSVETELEHNSELRIPDKDLKDCENIENIESSDIQKSCDKPESHDPWSHDSEKTHDYGVSHDLNKSEFHDISLPSQLPEMMDSKDNTDESESQSSPFGSKQDSLLVQRNQRRYFISFNSSPNFGSSTSLPETVGDLNTETLSQNGPDDKQEKYE